MVKNKKQIPEFKSEEEEREFWAKHSIVDYFEVEEAIENPKLENLKPPTKKISVRLPEALLEELKMLANKHDVPYQSLMKLLLAEKVEEWRRVQVE